MDATHFEYRFSMSPDARFQPALRALVLHTAGYAGCPAAGAAALADTVVGLVLDLGTGPATELACCRAGGPIEFVVAGHGPDGFAPPAPAGGVEMACRRDGAQWICTLSLSV